MNILIVHPCKGFYGGAEEVIVQLSRYIDTKGHQWAWITKDFPGGLPIDKNRVVDCSSYASMWKVVHQRLEATNVINVHNFPATLAAYPTKRPIVWYCNEPPELFTNWKRKPIEVFNRWWIRKSGMEVVVADQVNACRFFKIYKVKPRAIPYGVDYEFWSKGTACTREVKKVRLLQVGTISPYKNQLASLNTLKQLLERRLDAELTLAGGITDRSYHKYLTKTFSDVQDKVNWLGQKSKEEIRELFSYHDVLLHPVEGQGGWLVPFEAMCAGLPVITTPSFSASGLIEQNRLGVVTRIFSGSIFNKEYERLDTEAIKLWVRENLTWEKFGEGMVRIFEEVVGG